MADKLTMLASAVVALVYAPHVANAAVAVASTSLAARAFASFQLEEQRMRRESAASIANLTKHATLESALAVLRKTPKVTHEMLALIESSVRASRASKATSLRAHSPRSLAQQLSNPRGYSGVDSARNLLNSMLDEVNRKNDMEHTRCSDFFHQQCALLETCRQDIGYHNAMAAKFRGKVLDSQAEINICERELPRLRYELASSIHECTLRIDDLEAALRVVLADIQVMTSVLQMTDCSNASSTSSLLQLQVLKCADRCRKDTAFYSLEHSGLRKLLARLQPQTRQHVQALLSELATQEPAQGRPQVVLLQDVSSPGPAEVFGNESVVNVTNFTNPPLPQEPVPGNPCDGITFDNGLGKGDCSVSSNPQCYTLQGKFLAIQTGIVDTRDELLANLQRARTSCAHTQQVLDEEIERYDGKHKEEQTKLAEATEGETTSAEEARMKNHEHHEMEASMDLSREDCSRNLRTFESEMCSLRRIRGELYKMRGDGHPAFFTDCQVSEWQTEPCSVTCGGGNQRMVRSVEAHPVGGMPCPPLEAFQNCNTAACPISCELSAWSGWSACSSECGGGVAERVREILVQPRYGGEPCDESSETRPCNVQSCDVDCELAEWSDWSACSKACDTGHTERRRAILRPAVGAGSCPAEADAERLLRQPCNTQACVPLDPREPLRCQSKVDLILVLDGSGSVSQSDFDLTKSFATTLVRAFDGTGTDAQVSAILFSGPFTWSQYVNCTEGAADGSLPASCRVSIVQHLSNDTTATLQNIRGLTWPRGTTLTRIALQQAEAEVRLSRPDAQALVLVVTDGLPLSPAMTTTAAERLRTVARLMWVPVNLNAAGVANMRRWSSEPVEENLVNIGSFAQLASLTTINGIVARACPQVELAPTNWTDLALNAMYEPGA